MTTTDDARRSAPAALRNRDPILAVLREQLPATGLVLEVASGTGEHLVHFARNLPHLTWQPSDPSAAARQSIAAWTDAEAAPNILPPLEIDAAQTPWPVGQAAAVVCINMIHISPWAATLGLMRGAGQILRGGGVLYLYGPYIQPNRPLEPSNAAFDRDLRRQDARWGIRELSAVVECAAAQGLDFVQSVDMPANNLSVIFRKR